MTLGAGLYEVKFQVAGTLTVTEELLNDRPVFEQLIRRKIVTLATERPCVVQIRTEGDTDWSILRFGEQDK